MTDVEANLTRMIFWVGVETYSSKLRIRVEGTSAMTPLLHLMGYPWIALYSYGGSNA